MTSDSISARPMIMVIRIIGPALGLRAVPSTAAAIPRTNAAETTPQRTPVVAGAVVSACANIELATSARSANKNNDLPFLTKLLLFSFRDFAISRFGVPGGKRALAESRNREIL